MKVLFSQFLSRRFFLVIVSSLISAVIAFIVRVLVLYYFNLDALSIEDPFLCIFSLFSLNIFRLAIRSLLENLIAEPLSMNIGDIINPDTPTAKPSGSSVKPSGSSSSGSSNAGGPEGSGSSAAGPSRPSEPSSTAGPSKPSRPRPSRRDPSRFVSSVAGPSRSGPSLAGPSSSGPKQTIWAPISTPSKPPKGWDGSTARFSKELEWKPELIPASTGLPPVRPSTKPGLWSRYDPNWKPAEVEFIPLSESLREEMGPPLFIVTDNKYVITDPGKIAERGYIDPATKKSYEGSYQPYLKNLASALEHEALSRGFESAKFNWDKFDPQTQKFIRDWMHWNHNSLPLNGAYNCAFVRQDMVRYR